MELGTLSNIIDKEKIGLYIDLYIDDRLSVIENANRPKLDRFIKDEMVIFHIEGLKIPINTNLITVDFLDVTFDLFTGKYFPYRKTNDSPLYANANINHPRNILEQLPTMVNIRVSSLSINEDEFRKAKPLY